MAEIIDTLVSGTKGNPKIVEMDAEVIARILMRTLHVPEKPAIKAANEIADYIIGCMAGAASLS